MPLLQAEAEKLSQNDLVAGIVEEIIDREELFAILPFVQTKGKTYDYEREGTASEATFISPLEAVPEEASTFIDVTTKLTVLAGDVDVDKFLAGTLNDMNDQVAIQIAQKAKGIARKFRRTLIQGDKTGNPKEFDGVEKLLVGTGNRILAGANGAALTFSMLDELLDAVPNGADVLFMRPGTIRAYRALLRTAGGIAPAEIMHPAFGRPMLTHNGIPILTNEFILGNVTQGTSITNTGSVYAARLNEADGLHGLYGGESVGFAVEAIGTVQDKDAWRYRVKWYAGLALKSTKSMASIYGLTTV